MMLLTKENRKSLPKLYSQEHVEDPIVQVKFFTPWSNWTWYALEFDGKDKFFGLACGHVCELGYFLLSELRSIRSPYGLKVERDMHFRPTRLSEVKSKQPNPQKVASRNPRLSIPCAAPHITWGGKGYQCLNCGATADHSWNIRHKPPPPPPRTGRWVWDNPVRPLKCTACGRQIRKYPVWDQQKAFHPRCWFKRK